jgi:microsomal epoxide hydrolase
LRKIQALVEYWRDQYDWRRCEAMLNGFGQHRTSIDGLGVHFLHISSPEPDALPLILTHGWPGSVLEFHKMIGPLTNPAAHAGNRSDAFHLVVPSLPGFAFSEKPAGPGWGIPRIADAWITLMGRLGYDRWGAQGGDWGAAVTTAIGHKAPPGCIGIHLNFVMYQPTADEIAGATPHEQAMLDSMRTYQDILSGYAKLQSTRPQTIGYALADSPIGQAAWIYAMFQDVSDSGGNPTQRCGVSRMAGHAVSPRHAQRSRQIGAARQRSLRSTKMDHRQGYSRPNRMNARGRAQVSSRYGTKMSSTVKRFAVSPCS